MGSNKRSYSPRNLHLILVPLLAVVGMGLMFRQWWYTPQLIYDAHIEEGYKPWQVVDMLGTYGDMFGVTNALFSGVAMIAAISAIILQVFEFSAQREELTLQRQEMAIANKANDDRLKLDHKVFQYDRANRLRELLQHYRNPESNVERGLRLLSAWRQRIDHRQNQGVEVTIREIGRLAYSGTHWTSRKSALSQGRQGERDQANVFDRHVQEALDLRPLMDFLQQLSLVRPKPSELIIWKPILDRYADDILEFAVGAMEGTDSAPPLWPGEINLLHQRWRAFNKKGWDDKNDF